MIASIFKKSKPINFVIVLAILLLMYIYAYIFLVKEPFSLTVLGKQVMVFGISFFSVLLLNFIVVKNKLTEQSSYHILLFAVFLALFPYALVNVKVLLSNVFVLLAFRRLISMRSQIKIKKKLFDAAFWIGVAGLFYFWSLLFFILIFATLFLYSDNRIKNWIVPLTGIATVFVLLIAYQLVRFENLEIIYSNLPRFNFDYSNYNSIRLIVAITLLLSFGLWSVLYYLRNLRNMLKAQKPSHKIVVAFAVIGILVAFLAETKNSSEFLFAFAPTSIIIANYLDTAEENWFKETFLLVLVLSPIVLLAL